ncbi:MAG TPA: protein kinase [Chloroflexia bacterium]|nr:protein kinase [Chloroflexia bacterium]
MDLENKQLGAYRLISLIGKGGMAEVWLATQLTLNREVAVKVISEAMSNLDQGNFVARFAREAHAVAHLDHPSILPVIDYGSDSGFIYLVMPYVRGGSLQEQLKRELLTRAQAFDVFERILSGLSYAHRMGIIHRDLKPANILLYGDGRAVIADFGVAKTLNDNNVGLTQTGSAVGSPEYMAPEQFMGVTNYRSDLYAMGVILYRLLTGRALYSGTSSWEIGMRHLNDPLPLPDPLVPPPLENFLNKALNKRPEDRFATADEMAAAFRQVTATLSPAELQMRPPRAASTNHGVDKAGMYPDKPQPTTPLPLNENKAVPPASGPASRPVTPLPVPPVTGQPVHKDLQSNPSKPATPAPPAKNLDTIYHNPGSVTPPSEAYSDATRPLDPAIKADSFYPTRPLDQGVNKQNKVAGTPPPAGVNNAAFSRNPVEQSRPSISSSFPQVSPPVVPPAQPAITTSNGPEANPPKRNKTLPLILAGVALVAVIAIVAVIFLVNGSSKADTSTTPTSGVVAQNSPVVATNTASSTTVAATTAPVATAGATRTTQPTSGTTPPGTPKVQPALSTSNLAGHGGPVNAISWSKNGSLYLTASDDKTMHLWDASNNSVKQVLDDKTHPNLDRVIDGVLSQDGKFAVAATADKFVRVYNISSGIAIIEASDGVVAKSVAISGDNALVTYPGADVVHTWDLTKDNYGPDFKLNDPKAEMLVLSFSPDNKYLAVGLSNDKVLIFEVASSKLVLTLPASVVTPNPPTTLAWTPDSKQLAVGRQKSLEVYSLNFADSKATATSIADTTIKGPVSALIVSADGKRLAAGEQTGQVTVWSLEDNKLFSRFNSGQNGIIGLHWNADNSQITVAKGGDKPALSTFAIVKVSGVSLKVNINPMGDNTVKGTAIVTDLGGGNVQVALDVSGAEPGVHNTHIHEGTCKNQGPIIFPLNDLTIGPDGRGSNVSVVQVDFNSVTSGKYYINVHTLSGSVGGCGELTT